MKITIALMVILMTIFGYEKGIDDNLITNTFFYSALNELNINSSDELEELNNWFHSIEGESRYLDITGEVPDDIDIWNSIKSPEVVLVEIIEGTRMIQVVGKKTPSTIWYSILDIEIIEE